MMGGKLLKATFGVVFFWWALSIAVDLLRHPIWYASNFVAITINGLFVLGAVIVGGLTGWAILYVSKKNGLSTSKESLAGEQGRNAIATTLGPIPVAAPAPAMSPGLPTLIGLLPGDDGEIVARWLASMKQTHPSHHQFTVDILRVLNHAPSLPATHVPGGHGGRSLLEHSVLVCAVMLNMARDWEYKGLVSSKGNLVLPLKNEQYVFPKDSPVSGIVGLAHDIGKIESYIMSEDGNVIGSRTIHDLVGGRMIARMDSFWKLPDADQETILAAVSHYHHPMGIPLDSMEQAIHDDHIAVMELLIKADNAAGKRESETEYSPQAYLSGTNNLSVEGGQNKQPIVMGRDGVITAEGVYQAFLDVCIPAVLQPAKKGIGVKQGSVVYLKEEAVRLGIQKRMAITTPGKKGDGSYAITDNLLKELADRGLLMNRWNESEYSPTRAKFVVHFFDPKTSKHEQTWKTTIIVEIKGDLSHLGSVSNTERKIEIERPTHGATSGRKEDGVEASLQDGEIVIPEAIGTGGDDQDDEGINSELNNDLEAVNDCLLNSDSELETGLQPEISFHADSLLAFDLKELQTEDNHEARDRYNEAVSKKKGRKAFKGVGSHEAEIAMRAFSQAQGIPQKLTADEFRRALGEAGVEMNRSAGTGVEFVFYTDLVMSEKTNEIFGHLLKDIESGKVAGVEMRETGDGIKCVCFLPPDVKDLNS